MRHDRQTTVQKDSLVIFNGSRYSVPSAYIGKTVSLKQVENKLYIYYCTKPIAMHTISKKKLNYLNEHYTDLFSSKLKDPIAVQAVAETNLQLMDDFL